MPQETSSEPVKFDSGSESTASPAFSRRGTVDLKRYLVEEATGILITGNSGAGKTSSAVEIAGMLTESTSAEIIVLENPNGLRY
ncbi:hypothetical protein ACL6C3_14905 [Capilliphycus salinus ALCB114379]|uniref:hypothetical protein n=1 Tax=Capilliphycus salinus TaxID=2768948 RepID=UPI0039A5DC32